MIGSGVNRITLCSGVSIRGLLSGPLAQNSIPSFPVRSSRSIPYHDAAGRGGAGGNLGFKSTEGWAWVFTLPQAKLD